ncbi:hypothetical protein NPIL_271521 [Nephila pilipes]|uniref:Uncharacterized protein n=1 Tax=Nephila pilipes TaxID=299642 RepID=A0A8X6UHP6_NEPPI|nr:hypothetical protein NPIL_271521 [Nephila pilipes]
MIVYIFRGLYDTSQTRLSPWSALLPINMASRFGVPSAITPGPLPLVHFRGILTMHRCVHEVLESVALLYIPGLQSAIYQWSCCRPHQANFSLKALKGVLVLSQPAYYPICDQ